MDNNSTQDIIQRLRMMLMGQTPLPINQAGTGASSESNNTQYSVGLLNMPFESEGPQKSLNVLNSQVGYRNPETNTNIGLGFNVQDQSSLGGGVSYGPQVSAGYGPLNLMGRYRTVAPGYAGAKNQNTYQYGGNLSIPLDENERFQRGSGLSANLGMQADTGRMGTMLNAGLQAPLFGGILGVDVTSDPSFKRKELIAAFRRQF